MKSVKFYIAILWLAICLLSCTWARPTTVVPPLITPTPHPTSTRRPTPTPTTAANPPTDRPSEGVQEGQTALDFTLYDLQGQSVNLSDWRGKVVMLNFWALWCGPCRQEMPALQSTFARYADQGFVILGINLQDKPESVEPFIQDAGIAFPILLDQEGRVMLDYKIYGLPTSIFIDSDGVIQYIHVGMINQKQITSYLNKMGIK